MFNPLASDSGGVGDAPDAAQFGDSGANTIKHTAEAAGGLSLPNLSAMGLKCLLPGNDIIGRELEGAVALIHPRANGKDTLAGHWEMMGLTVQTPFRTYPNGFPPDVTSALSLAFGRPLLGNEAASGTEIINRLGSQHLESGWPIVYTSADSVLQIAAHEERVPLSTLYQWCEAARDIMQGPNLVGRIIARPFVGEPGSFVRTPNRHDYAVRPWAPTQVDALAREGIKTVAVGKIGDTFSGQGFSQHVRTESNLDGLEKTRELLMEAGETPEFIFVNLVEFDSHWGHRRNPTGYAHALQDLDAFLPRLWEAMGSEDQLWITADHGCDPTYQGTDHTREDVPWLVFGRSVPTGIGAPRDTLADIGATLAKMFSVPQIGEGYPWETLVPRREATS